MTLMDLPPLRKSLLFLASATGYPLPVRWLINRSAVDTRISASNPKIERGCYLFGDVTIAPGAIVERGAELRGSVELERGARAGQDSLLDGHVTVGRETNLVADVEAVGDINLGKFGAIARRVTFQGRDHVTHKAAMQSEFYGKYLDAELGSTSKGPINVGHDVWMGADATVLSGVEVGNGAIVAAGSVVTDDVEPYSLVAGVPAEHKKYRFSEPVRAQLLDIGWWDWPAQRIARNRAFFTADLSDVHDVHGLVE